MRHRRRAEDNAHPERWLVSYADFMTLMFALFLVLFASSHHDKQTIQRVSSALKNGFQAMGSFSDDANALQPIPVINQATNRGPNAPETEAVKPNAHGMKAGIDVVELQRDLSQALGKEIERHEVNMRLTPEGFVVSLHELGFFDSGDAKLLPGAADKIKKIAAVLIKYGLDMRVEGHSDDVPIHNATFSSNWDLSTARATAVAMMLLKESGVDPRRMSIAGYGEYHPVASNDTPEGRRANRRVDIVIVSTYKTEDNLER